ncbi:MAG: phosphoglucosamine mutase [Bacteroidales bacterium]
MTLITSISGIRGTIGGKAGEGLTPVDTVRFAAAYAAWLKKATGKDNPKVVLGRDARISGPMVEQLVSGALAGMGVDVVNISLATTPTVEMAVPALQADGGIILTASHNPKQWNALKLLNDKGEFLSAAEGETILELAKEGAFEYSPVESLGEMSDQTGMDDYHIQKVLDLPLVDVEKIRSAGFRVAIDCVNSVGGIILQPLLMQLGVIEVIELYCEPNGEFPHNPEPLPENLNDISALVKEKKADVGFVVDPDVDRLAIVCEDGSMFGEEYTLVAVADYVLSHTPGHTCSNLSSSRALRDVTEKHGGEYFASAVGEVNVVEKMKEENCIIGGEGNGGVIYPELHYGRDALVGIALFLSHLAASGRACSELRKNYPTYEMVKNKIMLDSGIDIDRLLDAMEGHYAGERTSRVDGLKIDLENGWVHLRKSNTEPIIRIYAEAVTKEDAESMIDDLMDHMENFKNV